MLSDINLIVNVQRKKVPKVMGVVNQVLFMEGAGLYAFFDVQDLLVVKISYKMTKY